MDKTMDRKICIGIFLLAVVLCANGQKNEDSKDGSTVAPATNKTADQSHPVTGSDQKRLSELKCEEYSRGVVKLYDELTLIPEHVKLGEYRHVAALGLKDPSGSYEFKCAGTLISPRYVLTVAQCLHQYHKTNENLEPTFVRFGDQNLDPSVQDGAEPIDVPIKSIRKHPDYKPLKFYNDIALVELDSDVQFDGKVRPACLWTQSDFGGHSETVVTGWDFKPKGFSSRENLGELEQIPLTLFDNANCDQLLKDFRNRKWDGLAPSQLCAGELKGGRYSKRRDAGSPLQVGSKDKRVVYVLGMTSFGRILNLPTVFTRVSAYLDWIEKTVWSDQ